MVFLGGAVLANIVSDSHGTYQKQTLTWCRWPTKRTCGYPRQNGRSKERARWRSWVQDKQSEIMFTKKLNDHCGSHERSNDNQVPFSHDCTQFFEIGLFSCLFLCGLSQGPLLVQHTKLCTAALVLSDMLWHVDPAFFAPQQLLCCTSTTVCCILRVVRAASANGTRVPSVLFS